MGKWGHDAESMQDWSNKLEQNNTYYSDTVNSIYNILGRFLNSPEFSGGLAENLSELTLDQRPKYLGYEDVINDCIDFMRSRANDIESDTDYLMNKARSNNPMGD